MILPDNTTKFSDFIAQLRVDYNSRDQIPYPVKEDDWRGICDKIANSPTFLRLGVPLTDSFPNWVEWGKMLYSTAAK